MTASAALFVTLNVVDAWLTMLIMGIGGEEANIFSPFYALLSGGLCDGSFLVLKGLLALAVIIVLSRLAWVRLLKPLNLAMVLVVALNGVCVLSYLAGRYGWV